MKKLLFIILLFATIFSFGQRKVLVIKRGIARIIMTTIAYASTIDVRYNPGYTACNKTIATAKNWTDS